MQIFGPSILYSVTFYSIFLGVISTLLSVFLGFIFSYFISPVTSRFYLFPFLISSTVIATFFLQHLSSLSWTTLGWVPILLCHAFINLGWVAIQIKDARNQKPEWADEVTQALGLNRWQRFYFLNLKSILPVLKSTAATVFVFSLTSFAPVLILGGGPPVSTLETESAFALRSLVSESFPVGQALLIQFFILIGVLYFLESGKHDVRWAPKLDSNKRKPSIINRILNGFFLLAWVVFFMPGLDEWKLFNPYFLYEILGPWWHSIQVALMSSVLSVAVVSFLMIRFSYSRFLFLILGALSPVTLGAFLFYQSSSEGSDIKVVFAQMLVFSAFAYRSFLGWQDPNFLKRLEVTRSLGLNFLARLRWVWWPSWGKVLIKTGTILFLFAFGDVVAVSLFADESSSFIQLEILRAAGRMDLDRAVVWSYCSLLTCLVGMLLLNTLFETRRVSRRIK